MDILGCMDKATKIGKYLLLALFAINLVSMASAQDAKANLQWAR